MAVNFSNKYPYTDFHELNLDWLIKEVKYWSEKVGKTIQSIELTGTVGLVDTYTINYSDGTTSTFDVTNGNGIASVAKTGTAGLVDTYTITFQDGSTTTFDIHNGTASIDPTLTLTDYAADAKATGDAINKIASEFNYINLFDKSAITNDNYIDPDTGELRAGTGFFASDYIDISQYNQVICSFTHIVAFYDQDKVYISGQGLNTLFNDASISRPATAKYMRFSSYLTYLDYAQIGDNVSRTNYIPFGKFTMPDLLPAEIIVDVNGGGDYTSLTEALFDNVDNGIKIIVRPGVYDIEAEYVNLFGITAVNNMADADSAIFNGFQFGIIIRNRTIEFLPGARVNCDWSSHTVDGTHRFCAVRVDYNATIIGLHLTAINVFYCIHDDYGLIDAAYVNKFVNCYVNGSSIVNINCIGGGCKKYSRTIIENCYFNNNLAGSTWVVRYHNTDYADAIPEIFISNSYFNATLSMNYYGTQNTKMTAYINNCEAAQIIVAQEDPNFSTNNVDLIKWNNTETL